MRFEVKSANKMNMPVTSENEQIKLSCSASSGDIKCANTVANQGEKAASPMMPPKMATALRPI